MSYTQNDLIDITMNKLENISNKNNINVVKPIIEFKNHKTHFNNFINVCESFNRGNDGDIKHLQSFFEKETNMKSSFDIKNNLLIYGNIRINKIQEIIKNYFNLFIKCKTCNSPHTIVIKKNRNFFQKCNKCKNESYCLKDY